jgi:FkbM family methyltransferase
LKKTYRGKPMKVFFDVGANRGTYTRYLLEQYQADLVIAVEPNPSCVAILKDLFKREMDRVVIVERAVSDKSEPIDFHICTSIDTVSSADPNWVTNSRFAHQFHWADPIKVETISLDELIDIHGEPQAIKIDVEGYELSALRSLTKKDIKSEISFEWTAERAVETVTSLAYLDKLGYDSFGFTHMSNDHSLRPTFWDSARAIGDTISVMSSRQPYWAMGMCFAKK